MVVSNPPYVSSEDMRKVEQTWYEGRFALQGKLPVSRPALSGSEHHAGAASSTQQQQKTTPAPASGRGVGGENGDVQDGDDGYTFYRRIKSLYSIFLDEASSVGDAELASTLADTVCASSTSDSSSTSATPNPGNSNSANSDNALPKLVLEVGAKQSRPVQEMYASEGRLEVTKETARRREVGAPQLEQGDMVGTERSVWVYRP
jgi:methylase of polypeptide subunit release factors